MVFQKNASSQIFMHHDVANSNYARHAPLHFYGLPFHATRVHCVLLTVISHQFLHGLLLSFFLSSNKTPENNQINQNDQGRVNYEDIGQGSGASGGDRIPRGVSGEE